MPHDRAAVPARQPAQIDIPDQLQQAKRPAAPRPSEPRAIDAADEGEPKGGVLHELTTDRAHD